MKMSYKLAGIAFGLSSIAVLSSVMPKYAGASEPFCQPDGNGSFEIKDPVSNAAQYKTSDVHDAATTLSHAWGHVDGARGLGFNINMKNGEIVSCSIDTTSRDGENIGTFYPKGPGVSGPKIN